MGSSPTEVLARDKVYLSARVAADCDLAIYQGEILPSVFSYWAVASLVFTMYRVHKILSDERHWGLMFPRVKNKQPSMDVRPYGDTYFKTVIVSKKFVNRLCQLNYF